MVGFDVEYWLWSVVRPLAIDGASVFERIPVPATPEHGAADLVIEGPVDRPAQRHIASRVLHIERRSHQRDHLTATALNKRWDFAPDRPNIDHTSGPRVVADGLSAGSQDASR